jgi:TetR/AcrR family transcriptional repressor of mexJK operon
MSTAVEAASQGVGTRAMKPQQIRAAAAQLFMQHGYGSVSMDAIAREAGVSKATIYAHFSDKAQLFAALMHGECERQWPVAASLDAEPTDLAGSLRAVAEAYAQFLLRPQTLAIFRMVISEAARFPELGRVFVETGPCVLTERLAAFLTRGHAKGVLDVPDPNRAAQQFLAMMRSDFFLSAVLGVGELPDAEQIRETAESVVAMFLKAYAVTPARGAGPPRR